MKLESVSLQNMQLLEKEIKQKNGRISAVPTENCNKTFLGPTLPWLIWPSSFDRADGRFRQTLSLGPHPGAQHQGWP